MLFAAEPFVSAGRDFTSILSNKNRPWKYQPLADAMLEILSEDDMQRYLWPDPYVSGIDIEAAGKRGDPQ